MEWIFLSDNTSALKREVMKHQEKEKHLPQISLDEIKRVALHAGANYYFVSLQLNEMNYNHEIKKAYSLWLIVSTISLCLLIMKMLISQ